MEYTVISNDEQIIAVMIVRSLKKEGVWKPDELRMEGDTGMAFYPTSSLKGFELFTETYGFRVMYDIKGNSVGILDLDSNTQITPTDVRNLNIRNYPELAYLEERI